VNAWTFGKSAAYLRASGQTEDLDFILRKIADLNAPFMLRNGEVVTCDPVSNTRALRANDDETQAPGSLDLRA